VEVKATAASAARDQRAIDLSRAELAFAEHQRARYHVSGFGEGRGASTTRSGRTGVHM
jgi:hypothetical protein